MYKVASYKCDIDNNLLPGLVIKNLTDADLNEKNSYEVVIWNNNFDFTDKHLANFPVMKIFINWGTSDKNILNENNIRHKGIVIKKIDYYATETLAEFIIMLLLCFERRIDDIRRGGKMIGRQLYGKKVGIIGLGKIGFKTASILKNAFNCKIYYHSRLDKDLPGYSYTSPAEIFKNCDYVIFTNKSKVYTLNPDLIKNKDIVLLNITNNLITPYKDIFNLIKKGLIRGYIGDSKPEIPSQEIPDGAVFFNHTGYLTEESKNIKMNILRYFLKKYVLQTSSHIFIARHGETKWNKTGLLQGSLDSALTRKGVKHAMSVAKYLKTKHINAIFSSPLERAKNTAIRIAEETGAELLIINEFREMNFGVFEGKYKKTNKRIHSDFYKARKENKFYKLHVPYPGGESYFDLYLRVLPKLMEILASYDNFVIVGHESINRIIRGIINEYAFDHMVDLRQKNSELIDIDLSKIKESVIDVDLTY